MVLTPLVVSQDGLAPATFMRPRNPEGTKLNSESRQKLDVNGELTPEELAQVVRDIELVNKDTVKVCQACERPKSAIRELVASGKGFSLCGIWFVASSSSWSALWLTPCSRLQQQDRSQDLLLLAVCSPSPAASPYTTS
jgi:hypothetical protein